MKVIKKISLLLCILLSLGCLSITAVSAEADGLEKSIQTIADCDGKRIGILTGSIYDAYAKESFPNAELLYFSSVSDLATALKSGSIDVFPMDILTTQALMVENEEFTHLDEALDYIPTAFAFSKDSDGKALCDEMSEFIGKIEENGTLAKLQDKWMIMGAEDYEVDLSGLDQNERTVVFATSCSGKPNSYYYNDAPTGYEVELAALFCRAYGYNLDIQVTDFAGIIPGLVSGKFDFGADGIAVTEERSQSVNFSALDYKADIVMVKLKESETQSVSGYTSLEQFNSPNVSLGLVTGTIYDQIYQEIAPKALIKYYNTTADLIHAITVGQVDGFALDEPMAKYYIAQTEGLISLQESVGSKHDYAFVFGGSDFDTKLQAQCNEYLAKIKSDGTFDKLYDLWFSEEAGTISVDYPKTGENGVVKIAVNAESPPTSYISNGEIVGLEMDILAHFCRDYGYSIELYDMDFSALLPGVVSGRYDIATGYIAITPERQEAVRFSDPYMHTGMLMVVRAPDQKVGFWEKLTGSFEKTFIRENRWKLIVQGIATTMIISIGASLLGTVLGFGLCLLRRMKNSVVHGITTGYVRIMQGTPILVLLMILFYIIFAKTGVSGEIVAIIAFALNFAAYVCEIFRSGIDSIDKGQTEAALAIGFTKTQTFFRVILPQAAMRFLPVYKGEFISLVKMTSIVGYIAVQDLTRMSDIIRSRTYEAFFPLIATAIIYFILSSLLTALLRAVEVKIEPKRLNKKVKGVKLP